MNLAATSWKYDAISRTVVDASGQTVICNVGPEQPAAVGELIANAPAAAALLENLPATLEKWQAALSSMNIPKALPASAVGQIFAAAPAMAAIALDLHTQLGASLSAWQGEEDSVQEEHADLIKDLELADARASAVLGASGDAALPADALRALAQVLLERAHELDGLKPYVVTHSHRHGDTIYTTWSASAPTDNQLAKMLGEVFEPDRGETAEHHLLQIAELTGASPYNRLGPDSGDTDQDEESQGAGERPSGM